MDKSFSWSTFDRMSRTLEALGYVVVVLGPLLGLVLLVFGDAALRLAGLALILASLLVGLYHTSFSVLMNGVHQLRDELLQRSDSKTDAH